MTDTKTVTWKYDAEEDDYYAKAGGISYHVLLSPRTDLWHVCAWPTGDGRESVVRRRTFLGSLAEAQAVALAMKPGEA